MYGSTKSLLLPSSARLGHHYRSFISSPCTTSPLISKPPRRATCRLSFLCPSLNNYFHRYCVTMESSWSLSSSSSFTTSSSSSDPKTNLSVAIVGSGPAGFYTAKYLQSSIKSFVKKNTEVNNNTSINGVDIDIIERLPTPYGLVRSGVAPDHPEVKNVENDFAALLEGRTGDNDGHDDEGVGAGGSGDGNNNIQFFGNVTIGKDVTLSELRSLYDVVILSYGCSSDRKLGIEGEDTLRGVLSAREFVSWYNGHPDFVHVGDKIADLLANPEEAQVVVIGQGNVALDCARILAKGTSGLFDTDIASHALKILKDGVKRTVILGRRGHIQGAFTIKELRELTKLEKEGYGASFFVREDELDMGTTPASLEELSAPASRPKVRIDKLLREAAASSKNRGKLNTMKEVELRFLLNPVKFVPNQDDPSKVGSVVCERTELKGEPGKQVAVGTGETGTFPADLVLVSIGYKGIPLPGMGPDIFDEQRGIVKNQNGKVMESDSSGGALYVSGWLKRGPSGIIGTNIVEAKDTVATLVADLERGEVSCNRQNELGSSGRAGLLRLLQERGAKIIDWASYKRIDEAEKDPSRRRSDIQPREKITNVEEMLRVCS